MSKKSVQELFAKLVRNLSEAKAYVEAPNKYLEAQGIVLADEQKAALDSAMKDLLKKVTDESERHKRGGHHYDYVMHMDTELLDPHEDYNDHFDVTDPNR